MDDILILGSNAKDIHKAMKLITEKAKELGLKIKDNWIVFTTVMKRKDDGHFIDMMGRKNLSASYHNQTTRVLTRTPGV